MTDRRSVTRIWIPLLFGILSLTSVITRPSVATYHKPDVIQLFASGVLLGLALGNAIVFFRGPRSS